MTNSLSAIPPGSGGNRGLATLGEMSTDEPRDLEALAERAVAAALDAGAGDAEAATQDSVGREIRIFDG